MNTFEIYTQMFYALNDECHRNYDKNLDDFLNAANPLYNDIIESVDPVYFIRFKIAYRDYGNDKDYGYYFVKEFLKRLGKPFLINAFNNMKKEDWIEFFEDYLNEEHKGSDIPEHSINNMLKKESEMNSFEIYCLLFFLLDYNWLNNYDDDKAAYLGALDPYIFNGIGSADSAEFISFNKAFNEYGSNKDFGYDFIMGYIKNIDDSYILKEFEEEILNIRKEDWIYWAIDYLSFPHLGMELTLNDFKEGIEQ